MPFKPPPAILQRVLRFKALKHEDGGKLTLWGIPAFLWPIYSYVYIQRSMEKSAGHKDAAGMMYSLGKFQSVQTFRMISQRFGYAKSISDKTKLLKFNTGQAEMAGLGSANWVKLDFDANVFIAKGHSTFADEYKRFFGIQKTPVDHFVRGCLAAYIEEASGENDMFCVETACVAAAKSYCEFVVRKKSDFSTKDLAGQEIKEYPQDIKDLGARIEPYLILSKS